MCLISKSSELQALTDYEQDKLQTGKTTECLSGRKGSEFSLLSIKDAIRSPGRSPEWRIVDQPEGY